MVYHRRSLFPITHFSVLNVRIIPLAVAALLLGTALAPAQETPDTVRRILQLHEIIERRGAEIGPRIWPGFRPDTIPTLYVIAHRAKVLVPWRRGWPAGFTPIRERPDAGIAGSGIVSLPSGQLIAFMSVDSTMSPGLVLGTAIHEAFHSFERSVMRDSQMFGAWENAMLVGSYPVFNVDNEAAFALEGKQLRRALAAPSVAGASRLAREFLALRAHRQGLLAPEYAEFERLAEMNEGLAQYALVRGLAEVAALEGGPWVDRARIEARVEVQLLDSLLAMSRRSVRRRFYATGSAMALLLDRLAPSSWKQMILQQNLSLQETLDRVTRGSAASSGELPPGTPAEIAALRGEAERSVARLRAARSAQADSLLALPGIRITIDPTALGSHALQWCGFDPQNTLQTGDGRMIHGRFLKVCAGAGVAGEFQQPVVQSDSTTGIALVVDPVSFRLRGAEGPLDLVEGEAVEVASFHLTATGVSLESGRARVTRRGRDLTVLLLPES